MNINDINVFFCLQCKSDLHIKNFDPHPLFKIVEGEIEKWEIIEKNNITHITEHIH